jgi:hypothetical protein
MTSEPSIIERAFELARSGRCRSIKDVRQKLKDEKFSAVDDHIAGPSIVKQLKTILAEAHANAAPPSTNADE